MKIFLFIGTFCLLSVSLFAAEAGSACAPEGVPPERVQIIRNSANTIANLLTNDVNNQFKELTGRDMNDEEVDMFLGLTVAQWQNSHEKNGCRTEFGEAECRQLGTQIRACVQETLKARRGTPSSPSLPNP